jgi:hypothetical protein
MKNCVRHDLCVLWTPVPSKQDNVPKFDKLRPATFSDPL